MTVGDGEVSTSMRENARNTQASEISVKLAFVAKDKRNNVEWTAGSTTYVTAYVYQREPA